MAQKSSAPPRKTLMAACEALGATDPAFARAYAENGVPVWRARPATYATLARLIAFQQISTRAADTIWTRVEARLGEVTPSGILALAPEALQACGLSRPKVAHLRSIATALDTGALDLARVRAGTVEAGLAELVAVKGIGPWTANIFLMSASGHLDAFPAGDIGLIEAYRALSNKKNRLEIKAFNMRAERWRPYRGVAAHLLWGWLNAQRAEVDGKPRKG